MKKRVLKKTFLLLAILGLVSFNMNAQTHDQTFSDNASFQFYNNAYGAGTRSHDPTGGLTGDGAFKLVREGNNNSNFGFNGGIDATTKKVIKIRYKNETTAPNIQIKGKNDNGTDGDTADDVDLGTTIKAISSNSSEWNTLYIDLSGVAAWTNNINNLDILVKGSTAVPASGDAVGSAFYLDEITFLDAIPADEFSDFVPNPSFEDPTGASKFTGGFTDGVKGVYSISSAKDGIGVYGFKFTQDQTASNYTFNTFQKEYGVTYPAGTKIQVKMWVKTNRNVPVVMNVRFNTRQDGANTNITKTITTTNTAQEWEQLTFDAEVATGKTFNQMRFWFAPGYTASSVNNFNNGDYIYIDKITAGVFPVSAATTPGNWAAGASWGGAVPGQGNAKTIGADIDVNSAVVSDGPLDVTTGNTLTIKAGNSLTLNSDINIDGTLNLEAGAQLIVKGNSTGNASFVRTLPAANGGDATLDGWFSMSPPFSGATINNAWATSNGLATSASNNRGLATYVENGDSWVYLKNDDSNVAALGTNFEAGRGYIVKQSAAGDITFTGTINSSEDGVDVSVSKDGNGFNLLGSPYSALINSGTFITDNTTKLASQEVWIWNDDGNTYDSKPSGMNFKLAPGQAFFVKVNAAGTLNFKQSNQEVGGDTFLRGSSDTKIKLSVTEGTSKRFAEVYYFDNATKGFDIGFEGTVFKGTSQTLSLYTQMLKGNEDGAYQVQSLPNTDLASMVIPVGLKAAAGKEITFTAEALNLPSGIKVYLEDRVANTFTRLDETNTEYKITLTEALDGVGRFYLYVAQSALSVEDSIILNSVSIFKTNNSTLRIAGLPQGKASMTLYNILGKQVMTTSFEADSVKDISLPKLATGVYFAKLQTVKGKISKKIILE
jgi:hypothetical protein